MISNYSRKLDFKFEKKKNSFEDLLYLNGLLDLFDNSVLDAGLTQDVVRGDAGLTAVGVLSPGDAPAQQHS